ncbi:DNA cytosine methyltransferase [Nocardioides pantholopis]|uniref:DNA cytosine methyltransferase n=1 Tax=Nocardioides pantholopis TaxID=2483798 RepID=UPI000F0950A1|nr:DNA cytosine methyltransferase [Nocardioides pantholopis]
MPASSPTFRFIDLFAGVGGFHAALASYGGKCVYAVEVDKAAASVYERNWGHPALGDITKDADKDEGLMKVPAHDVLAAGFPCQPFSKSGAQHGMDETRGTLFWNIASIIEAHHPKVVLLENVRNLAGPRHIHEWDVIIETLQDEGYRVSETPAIFSPHLLPPERGGRPQVRERVFITATHNPEGIGEGLPVHPVALPGDSIDGWGPQEWHLEDLLDDSHNIAGCDLTPAEQSWINAWDEWVQHWYEATEGRRPPGFPIWADAWTEHNRVVKHFGFVPGYRDLMEDDPTLPKWKAGHLAKNYDLYARHRGWIDVWARKWNIYTDFPPSRRKLEWQAQDTPRLWDTVMHFRPSGIRAKRPTYLPALVAITQTSIIGPRRRRLSPRETARLQGLPDWFDFGDQRPAASYKQMGNGVNVGAVWHVMREHVMRDEDVLKHTAAGRRIIAAVTGAPPSPDEILGSMK